MFIYIFIITKSIFIFFNCAIRPIDLIQLEEDEIQIDTLKELLKFLELIKITQKVAKKLENKQSCFLVEFDDEEYQFEGKERPRF